MQLFDIQVIEGEDGGEGDVEDLLSLGGNKGKCRPKEELSGADALAAMVEDTCDMDGMDGKVRRVQIIQQL